VIVIQWVAVTEVVKILDINFMAHCNVVICPKVTLLGDAKRPKVADAVIKANGYNPKIGP